MFEFFKKKQKPSAIPPEALCLWVHRQHHLSGLSALSERRGEAAFLNVRHLGVYDVVVGLSTQQGAVPVKEEQLASMGLTHEAAFTRACENAHEQLQTVGTRDGVCFWEGFHAPAMLLMAPFFREHLPLQGAPVLMLPSERVALMAGADDPKALSAMLELALDVHGKTEDFVSLRAVTWHAGESLPVEWFPEDDHPLADQFRAARSRTAKHEAEGLHHVFATEAAPLAHLATMPPEKGGQLFAPWMRDANVVLPAVVDRVVLIDTDDEPLPRVEVELETLLESFPHAFEPIACGETEEFELEDAQLVRTRGVLFPTLSEKRYLVARQALLDAAPDAAEAREVPAREVLAAWDAGDALIARPEGDDVLVLAADGRCAFVPLADFGDRMSTRPTADRQRFAQGHLVNALLSAMFEAASEDGADDEPPSDEPAPTPTPEEFAPSTRPRLLSSNDLRHDREAGSENSLAEQLMQYALASAEPSKLFPLVRPPHYNEAQQQNELGMVQGMSLEGNPQVVHSSRVARSGPEGLQFELVSDAGNRVMPLDGRMFEGELRELAWTTALLNLKAASLSPPHRRGEGWYEGPWHDDFDASRLLLLPAIARGCRVKGEPLVFAPTVGRTWVVGSDDVEAMRAVIDAIEAHLGSEETVSPYQFRQLLFGWPWVVRGEGAVRWDVPAGHPLSARIAKLDEALARRRRDSRQHIASFARAAVSPLQPRESDA